MLPQRSPYDVAWCCHCSSTRTMALKTFPNSFYRCLLYSNFLRLTIAACQRLKTSQTWVHIHAEVQTASGRMAASCFRWAGRNWSRQFALEHKRRKTSWEGDFPTVNTRDECARCAAAWQRRDSVTGTRALEGDGSLELLTLDTRWESSVDLFQLVV